MMRLKTVLLRLQGPMQAWGGAAPWSERTTERTPTKSGIIGLVGAALGVERGSARLSELARALTMAVRVDLPGGLLIDWHTSGAGTTGVPTAQRRRGRDEPIMKITNTTKVPEPEISHRHYLTDAAFLVALTGAAPLVEDIHAALRRPQWMLYLGRRTCLPSAPIAAGISDAPDPVGALQVAPVHPRCQLGERLRIVAECGADEGAMRMDVPIAPAQRRFGPRWVRDIYWTPPSASPQTLDTLEG